MPIAHPSLPTRQQTVMNIQKLASMMADKAEVLSRLVHTNKKEPFIHKIPHALSLMRYQTLLVIEEQLMLLNGYLELFIRKEHMLPDDEKNGLQQEIVTISSTLQKR